MGTVFDLTASTKIGEAASSGFLHNGLDVTFAPMHLDSFSLVC